MEQSWLRILSQLDCEIQVTNSGGNTQSAAETTKNSTDVARRQTAYVSVLLYGLFNRSSAAMTSGSFIGL